MSAPEINGRPIPVPDGFRFCSMHIQTDSWDAYDALTEADGWTPRTMPATPTHVLYKTLGDWPGGADGYVHAHPPDTPRPSDRIAEIYGITPEQAERMARSRRVPHALRRDLGGPA